MEEKVSHHIEPIGSFFVSLIKGAIQCQSINEETKVSSI